MINKNAKVNKGIRVTSTILLIGGMVCSSDSVMNLSSLNVTATAATRAAGDTISLENGDFESPAFTTTSNLIDQDSVPGWNTSASDGIIELQGNNFMGITPPSGKQWAELNAFEVSALYQDIPTPPGTTVRWQVFHKGRQGTDTAVVEFGAPGDTMIQQAEMVDGNVTWGLYKGSYTIPAGQTVTRFQFRSISAAGGNDAVGNLLDNIQFATPSVLEINGTFSDDTIQVNKNVVYTVNVTNVGGLAAANNTITVKIPEELTYTAGSLSSANTNISNEQYDATTRTLTFTIDTLLKDASADIQIPLTGTTVTPAATPETSATYNDENFDEDIYTADGTDTPVAIGTDDPPELTGESNTTLNPGDTFDPMSTMAATDTEDGDLTNQIDVTNNPVDTSVPGTYEVTYEVTDSDGNTATFTRTVVVTEGPVLTGEDTTVLNPNTVFDPLSTMSATDNEDGDLTSSIEVTSNPVDTSIPGTYEVTYEVTDSDGNTATFTRTVIVTEAPVITGEATTEVNPNSTFDPLSTITATDNEDGDLTGDVVVTDNPVDTSIPGTYEVTYEVTDSDGNTATFTRTVIVTEAPVITGDSTTIISPNSEFDPMSTISATDNEDGDLTGDVVVTDNPVDTSIPGTYLVTYEVTDSDGNTATFTRTVIVTEAPVITGEATTEVNPNSTFDPLSTIAATDNEDGDLTGDVVVTDNPVDTSIPGTYLVTYEVTDSDGNTSTFTRTVIVTEAPVITGDSMTKVNPNSTFDPLSTIVATDNEDGDITGDVKVTDNPVDTNVPGPYTVTYEVTDSDGNTSTFTRTVIVTEAPVITGDSTTTVNPNSDFDPMSTMGATDNEDGDITQKITIINNPVDTSIPGIYKVTYEVTDSDGNTATFTRTVTVTEAPVFSGGSTVILQPGATFDPLRDLGAEDKEDGDVTTSIVVVDNPVDTSKPGSYKVTYKVTDSDGNTTMFTRTVIVEEAPIIKGEPVITIPEGSNFDPMDGMTASDKEDGDLTTSIMVISNPVDTSKPGKYEVQYEVTDSAGNVTTFSRTVIVEPKKVDIPTPKPQNPPTPEVAVSPAQEELPATGDSDIAKTVTIGGLLAAFSAWLLRRKK